MLEGKKILMTGCSGFFGKNIFYHAPYLAERNKITLLSRNPEKLLSFFPDLGKKKNLSFLSCDIRDFSCKEYDYDLIIHGAASFGRDVTERDTYDIIRKGTENILSFAKKNPRLEKLLFISSGAVYGRRLTEIQSEDMLLKPCEPYGWGKKEAEEMCILSGVPCVIARCFAFAGEFMELNTHFAIGNFISDVLHERDIVIKGDGTAVRSFMYSGDLVKLLLLLAESEIPSGRIYNVGSDEAVSIGELAEITAQCGEDFSGKIITEKKYVPGTAIDIYVPDISRIRLELNTPSPLSLEETVRRTMEFFRSTEMYG